jgi:hypothetical protein
MGQGYVIGKESSPPTGIRAIEGNENLERWWSEQYKNNPHAFGNTPAWLEERANEDSIQARNEAIETSLIQKIGQKIIGFLK